MNLVNILENTITNHKNDIALIDTKLTYTYEELGNMANQLGKRLYNIVGSKQPIIIISERDIRCIVMFWGILYSGNFYVPINFKDYQTRLLDIVKQYEIKIILSCDNNDKIGDFCKHNDILYFNMQQLLDDKESTALVAGLYSTSLKIIDTDPAYMVFTSGSTGMPKGVVKSHRSVIEFIKSFLITFNLSSEDIFGNQVEFDYDVAAKDIFISAYLGAKVVTIDKKMFMMPIKLLEILDKYKITTLIWSVAAIRLVARSNALANNQHNIHLKNVFFSGEPMAKADLQIWIDRFPNVKFVNLYAPTEVTGNCLYHIINNKNVEDRLPLTSTFDNIEIMILDTDNNLSNRGELVVRGAFIAQGYYKDEEATKNKFCQNPLHNDFIDIVYKTGDIVERINNKLYFCGRMDYQVKYQGHRIELFEIENIFLSITHIQECVCLVIEDKLIMTYSKDRLGNDKNLLKDIKTKMRQQLPRFKVPTEFIVLDSMPLSARGKIDRNQIKDIVIKRINSRIRDER